MADWQMRTSTSAQGRAEAKTEMDEIVAEECVFCGDMMIASIDQPFISPEQQDDWLRSWTLPGNLSDTFA
jgi:hypothetical protein